MKLRIAQIVNCYGISNYIFAVINADFLRSRVTHTTKVFSLSIFSVSLFLIVIYSLAFLKDKDSKTSSVLSPFLKYILPNPIIGLLFVLLVQAFFKDTQLLKLFALVLLLAAIPLFLLLRSVFLVLRENELEIHNYESKRCIIRKSDILKVDRFLLGFIYSLKFTDDKLVARTRYFFPKNFLYFIFSFPPAVDKIRTLIVM